MQLRILFLSFIQPNNIGENIMYEIVPRPAPAKKTNGYDVYHKNSARRVWVGTARTKREAGAIKLGPRNGRMR